MFCFEVRGQGSSTSVEVGLYLVCISFNEMMVLNGFVFITHSTALEFVCFCYSSVSRVQVPLCRLYLVCMAVSMR